MLRTGAKLEKKSCGIYLSNGAHEMPLFRGVTSRGGVGSHGSHRT